MVTLARGKEIGERVNVETQQGVIALVQKRDEIALTRVFTNKIEKIGLS